MINTDSYTVAWKCWYVIYGTIDVIEYNSLDHDLDELPDEGFQAMRLWYSDETGRFINGNDNYYFAESGGKIVFGQTDEDELSIKSEYPDAIIKTGSMVSNELMDTIHQTMIDSIIPQIN